MNDEIRAVLTEWSSAVEEANRHEDELFDTVDHRPMMAKAHIATVWDRLARAHLRLTELGEQCMTPEQAAVPVPLSPVLYLTSLRPKLARS